MIETLDIKSLALFYYTFQGGTLTTAGRMLGLSQSAASRQLGQLEKALGFALFHRDRGRLLPTSDATILFRDVEQFMAVSAHLHAVVSDIADYRKGEIRIVTPPSFGEAILPPILSEFLTQFPGIHVTIESFRSVQAMKLIANRSVDLGILPLATIDPDLTARHLVSCPMACVLPRTHALAASPVLDPKALAGEPMILLGTGQPVRRHIDTLFAQAGARLQVRVETRTVSSACALAAQGIGITVVNALLARHYLGDTLVSRPIEGLPPAVYGIVTPKDSQPSRLTRSFTDIAHAHFA